MNPNSRHVDATRSLLTRQVPWHKVAASYELTSEEETTLRRAIDAVDISHAQVFQVLLAAQKRKGVVLVTYEQSITPPSSFSEEYTFSADLCWDYPEIFGEVDNHAVADTLREEGVFDPEFGDADPESGCYYVYFKTEPNARAFVTRLNTFLVKELERKEKENG